MLTLSRWLRLYLPLSLTFLLMSGSSPIINKGIGHLPDETTGLAAFLNAFVIAVFLYSPCFAVRDAAQKFVRGRTSHRRTLVFHLLVAGACTGLLLFVALTPFADGPGLRGALSLPPEVVPLVKRALVAFSPIPTLVTIRGVYQAVHITNDTPAWVGIGTAARFAMLATFVFAVGVPLRLEGAVMGGLAFSVGIATETAIVWLSARPRARFLRVDHPTLPPPTVREIWGFSGPLFLANAMGIFLQPLTNAIVNAAIFMKPSAAAFSVVRSFTWFFCSTLFAMQTMTLARADSLANLRRLVLYGLLPVGIFTGLILAVFAVPGARSGLLRGFFEIDDPLTLEFIRATLPFALVLPAVMAVRSTGRGLLMRGGRTSFVTLASMTSLTLLLGVKLLDPTRGAENGAVTGYLAWTGCLVVETVLLVAGVLRAGVLHCVTEGGRSTALPVEPGPAEPGLPPRSPVPAPAVRPRP